MKYYKMLKSNNNFFNLTLNKYDNIVENELLTEREFNKRGLHLMLAPNEYEIIEISKNKTFYFFGCRFFI